MCTGHTGLAVAPYATPIDMNPLLEPARRRWWDAAYKRQVQAALGAADDDELGELCDGLLAMLCSPDDSFCAMQLLDHASRDEEICKRLLTRDAFRSVLEQTAGCDGTRAVAASGPQLHCRSALRLLRARSSTRREQVIETAQGGAIRILENLAFGGQATCRGDGTLKTGGVIWAAAHCLVDLMQRLSEDRPDAFRGKSVLELGAGCVARVRAVACCLPPGPSDDWVGKETSSWPAARCAGLGLRPASMLMRGTRRCGYVGIFAARLGAVVTMTDRADHLQHLQHNVNLNGLEHCVRVAELEWTESSSSALAASSPSFDWVATTHPMPSQAVLERTVDSQTGGRRLSSAWCAWADTGVGLCIRARQPPGAR